jgi:beta-glucanase (GH16 family)
VKKSLLIILSVMGAAGLCRVHAQLLDVNFIDDSVNVNGGGGNAPAPSAMSGAAVTGSPGDTWNGLGGFAYSANPNGATFTSGTLVYANGASSGISLSLTATNGSYDANSVSWGNYSPFSWASLANEQGNTGYPNTPWAVLMASLLVSHTAGVTDTVSLSGLVPGGTYNLYVYSAGDLNLASGATPGQRRSTFTVNGVTQTSVWQAGVTTLVNGTDYLEFTNVVASGTGNLVINYGNSANGDETDFNGFQLQTVTNQISSTNPPATQWNIVWSDEFNGTSINRNNWTYDLGGGGWGNSELETYTSSPQNSYVSNGLLHIVVLQSGGGTGYTSARMKTQGLYNTPTYGRFQWRAALPAGTGMWPALWLLGSDYPSVGWPACGEIDVVENNGATPTWVQGSLHSNSGGPTAIYNLPNGGSTTNFHIYELDWTPTTIQWLVDGHVYETQSIGAPFNAPFFFIMNVAVGGNYVGNPSTNAINSGTVFPQQMLVDYVRVLELTAPLALSTATQSNGSMTLSWPTNIVCHLQVQTNSLVGGNWTDLPGTTSPYGVTPDPNQSAVFYRLVSP